MKIEQDFLRENVKRLKWQENISYKQIAEDLLSMNYNSFINWLHCYADLGSEKAALLKDYIECILY